jgi:peptidoglycan hydrolase FlgJ
MMSASDIATLTNNRTTARLPVSDLKQTSKSMSMEEITKTAKDFETVFISQMVDKMFGESLGTEAFGDEDSGDIYQSMMVEEYSKQIVSAGGIGIADQIKKQLLKLQER